MANTEETPRTAEPPRNTVALLAGFGIGVLWVLMGGTSIWSAIGGYANQRYDWGLAWGVIGLLLLAAGLISMFATWHHLTTSRDSH